MYFEILNVYTKPRSYHDLKSRKPRVNIPGLTNITSAEFRYLTILKEEILVKNTTKSVVTIQIPDNREYRIIESVKIGNIYRT